MSAFTGHLRELVCVCKHCVCVIPTFFLYRVPGSLLIQKDETGVFCCQHLNLMVT